MPSIIGVLFPSHFLFCVPGFNPPHPSSGTRKATWAGILLMPRPLQNNTLAVCSGLLRMSGTISSRDPVGSVSATGWRWPPGGGGDVAPRGMGLSSTELQSCGERVSFVRLCPGRARSQRRSGRVKTLNPEVGAGCLRASCGGLRGGAMGLTLATVYKLTNCVFCIRLPKHSNL